MATNNIQTALRNTLCDAFVDAIDASGSGLLEIHTSGFGTKLATLTFSATAYGNAASGTAQEASITSDSSADNTGTAAVYRITTGSPTTLWEGTVSTSGQDINFNSVAFVAGDTIACSDLPITMPAS